MGGEDEFSLHVGHSSRYGFNESRQVSGHHQVTQALAETQSLLSFRYLLRVLSKEWHRGSSRSVHLAIRDLLEQEPLPRFGVGLNLAKRILPSPFPPFPTRTVSLHAISSSAVWSPLLVVVGVVVVQVTGVKVSTKLVDVSLLVEVRNEHKLMVDWFALEDISCRQHHTRP